MSNINLTTTPTPIRVSSSGVSNVITLDRIVLGNNAQTKIILPFSINANTPRMNVITKVLNNGFVAKKSGIMYIELDYIPEIEDVIQKLNDAMRAEVNELVGMHPQLDSTGVPMVDDNGNPVMVDRYVELKEKCWEDAVLPLIIKNRKKSQMSKIRKQFDVKFPCREQFLLVGVRALYDMVDETTFNMLPANTQSILKDSENEKNIDEYKSFVDSKCAPVLASLAKIRKQSIANATIHGSTVKAYMAAIDNLKIANATHLNFDELDEFIKIALRIIDDPLEYVDRFANSWSWFYAQHGMFDEFPYDDFELTREDLKEIGKDHANSFSGITN